ncbi:MAG: hypothetical protein ACK5LT_13340 [Lachnospirales bacterium]
MKILNDLLEDKGGNYILPFLWMHGENHEIIREEINKIEECGIKEICIESRPHPDFCGDGWWEDLDFIISEAKKRNMLVWVLDDDKFPTGHGNGSYKNKYPELSKVYLAERHVDVVGPTKESALLINPFLGEDGKLIGVVACKKTNTETLEVCQKDYIDLSNKVHNGFVYFDLPEGRYRIFVIFTTQKNGGRDNYINLIDEKSVRVLIDEVYEKHYSRYKADFGKTFAGFFSDEPELGNTLGYSFKEKLGNSDVKLPWSERLYTELVEKWGDDFLVNLPALWHPMEQKTNSIRSEYMDILTKLIYKCFSGQIGSWCEKHGVEYIGHIIEDDNAHSRLGCSVGHYFREQKGQHMSGIDVVHFQIMPGFEEKIHQWIAGDADGEFFHFALGKMGSSAAHIDSKKNGRALCEIFGNYGWAEGVSLMEWLTNHMVVRGINNFVPHAFSPLFPDKDCPPHFYARGNNPQFKFFAQLMKYMNRLCHLISNGRHIANVAVLYHGEMEWCNEDYMLFQKPVRKLMEAQLDCDVIPIDVLKCASVKNRKLLINNEVFDCLVIPYCKVIPKGIVDFILKNSTTDFKIYIMDKFPEYDEKDNFISLLPSENLEVINLNDLGMEIHNKFIPPLTFNNHYKYLRTYCYEHRDGRVHLFFNESFSKREEFEFTFNLGEYDSVIEYDPMINKCQKIKIINNTYSLALEPGEFKVLIPSKEDAGSKKVNKLIGQEEINCQWNVALLNAQGIFEEKLKLNPEDGLPNMNGKDYFSDYTGVYKYTGYVNVDKKENLVYKLLFPKFGDCAEVYINGVNMGKLLSSPKRINVTDEIIFGTNELIVEITNTLVWSIKDGASTHMQVDATGLSENPILEMYK